MSRFTDLITAISDRTLARTVGVLHDEARLQFTVRCSVVENIEAFFDLIAEYYIFHFTRCVAPGGTISPATARASAKAILEKEYRRHQGDIVSAYQDAHLGTNGGLRKCLDLLADSLKAQAIENEVRENFDRVVSPASWPQKIEIIRQFFDECAGCLNPEICTDQPERYAHDYEPLIRSYVDALKSTSAIFRRL